MKCKKISLVFLVSFLQFFSLFVSGQTQSDKIKVRRNACTCSHMDHKPSGDGFFEIEFNVKDSSGKYIKDFSSYTNRWCVSLLIGDSLVSTKPVLGEMTTFQNLKPGMYNIRVCDTGLIHKLPEVLVSKNDTRYHIYETELFPKRIQKKPVSGK